MYTTVIIGRSLDLKEETCISSLCLCDTVVSTFFNLQLSSLVPNILYFSIIKAYSFHFCHLNISGIMKEAISSQNMT